MPRYIDADKLIQDLKNRMQNTFAGDWILKVIKDQPDIASCEDCKHRCCDDGFCHRGERIDIDD